MRTKNLIQLGAELAIVAGLTVGCSSKGPLPPTQTDTNVSTPQAWQNASEKVIKQAEESEIRKLKAAEQSANSILQGRREQFLFDRIAAAAKLEAAKGEAGVYLLMAVAFVGSKEASIKAGMEAAYKAAGLDGAAIDNLLRKHKLENCAHALPGFQVYQVKDRQGNATSVMDAWAKPYGPYVKRLKETPGLCAAFGQDIATLYQQPDGKVLPVLVGDDPVYKAYMQAEPAKMELAQQ